MFLYHYYDREVGLFCNLSDLSVDTATELLDTIRREKPNTMCAKRQKSYVQDRLYYEKLSTCAVRFFKIKEILGAQI